jgi:hypothetical protein
MPKWSQQEMLMSKREKVVITDMAGLTTIAGDTTHQ